MEKFGRCDLFSFVKISFSIVTWSNSIKNVILKRIIFPFKLVLLFVVELAQRHDVIYVFVVCTVQCCTYEHIFNFYLKKAPNSILYKYAKFVI